MPAGGRRAVEAVEDVAGGRPRRSRGRGRARSARRRGPSPRSRRPAGSTSRRCRAGSRPRARSSPGTPRIIDSSSSGLKRDAGPVAACALDRVSRRRGRAGRPPARSAPGHRARARPARRSAPVISVSCSVTSRRSCSRSLRRQRLVAGEHLDVRAQARQRRPQLVRRVGDELPLRARRVLERAEHRVERRGEPRELVVAATRRSGARGRASPRLPPPSWSGAAPVRARPRDDEEPEPGRERDPDEPRSGTGAL